jgi:beta-glucosidase
MRITTKITLILCFFTLKTALFSQKWSETKNGTIALVKNQGGQTLGYSTASGVKILTIDGLAFKDMNKNGQLDKYEDWRLPMEVRAKDLATKLSVDQIAGLMLYSRHQSIPARAGGYFAGTYKGKPYKKGEINEEEMTD